MSHLRVVKTGAELKADEERARLTRVLHTMGLTEGQTSRLAALIQAYAIAQFDAGISRGEANNRPDAA